MTGCGGLHPHDDAGHAMYEEQHRAAPDPNPSIECAECGEPFSWMDYWKPRVTGDGRIENPHEDPWLCDPCHERKARLERRRENNRELAEWSS